MNSGDSSQVTTAADKSISVLSPLIMVIRIFSITISFLILPLLIFPSDTSAVKDPKLKYRKVQRDIKKKKNEFMKARRKERTILEEITSVNRELDTIKHELKRLEENYTSRRKEVESLRNEIKTVSERITSQKVWLKRKVRAMQKYSYSHGGSAGSGLTINGSVMLLMKTEEIPRIIRRWRYMEKAAEYEYLLLSAYSENLNKIRDKESRLGELIGKVERDREQLFKKKSLLKSRKSGKRRLLASVQKKKSLYKSMISELRKSSKRLFRIIKESEETGYRVKGFSRRKRRLSWPVKGIIALPYGSYRDPQFNTPVYRNGIHISAGDRESVQAVHAGRVVFADWFRGYGKVVIIDHGEGYHTVYANLSEIFLRKGDIIKGGSLIGRVGDSGTLDAPGLYFEVRYKGKPLNPMHWLKKKGIVRKGFKG